MRTHWLCWSGRPRSPLLLLLVAADSVSAFLGECTDALIIGVIIAASVGLGFGNEYRAERAAEALHSQVRHVGTVLRDGAPTSVEVTHVVPGDVVHLDVGSTVPADMRVLAAEGLACDESILTSESTPAAKSATPVGSDTPLAELLSARRMGWGQASDMVEQVGFGVVCEVVGPVEA